MPSDMRDMIQRAFKRFPVIPMIKALPEQPRKSFPIRDLIHFPKLQSLGELCSEISVQGELQDRLFLIDPRESGLIGGLYLRCAFLIDRDSQPGIVLQLPVCVVQDFRVQRIILRQ